MKKVLLGLGALAIAVAVVPMFAAFEAHVINVTAQIENALNVPLNHLDFGTVFPQEHLEKELHLELSESFMREPRVDDVEYFIRQKPKCGLTNPDGTALSDPRTTWTGHIVVTGTGTATDPFVWHVDCNKDRPADVEPGPTPDHYLLPSLCEYISKDGEKIDPDPQGGIDGVTPSFHKPWTIDANGNIVWHDTKGRLAKSIQDIKDWWIIDLAVPCFGGHCAQDWDEFVHEHNQQADPDQYVQPIENEHKIFGCNLWIEVRDVSERPETGTLTIIKSVVGDGIDEVTDKVASDFTIDVTGTNPSSDLFPGSAVGTVVTFELGAYSVDEVDDFNYSKALSAACSGIIVAGDNGICTITNTELPQCSDGLDNDGDGDIDAADDGCLDDSAVYDPTDDEEFIAVLL